MNWIRLLEAIPKGEDLHLISTDGDFFSVVNETEPRPFLVDEWQREKQSSLCVYRSLGQFVKQHFEGMKLTFDPERTELIKSLAGSGSFATTHSIVGQLSKFDYFPKDDAKLVIFCCMHNGQVAAIAGDTDIAEFLAKAILPYKGALMNEDNKALFEIAEQAVSKDDDIPW